MTGHHTGRTPKQRDVGEEIDKPGYEAPCGHHSSQMVVRSDGQVTCHHVMIDRHRHMMTPGTGQPLHTGECLDVICGHRFWPLGGIV